MNGRVKIEWSSGNVFADLGFPKGRSGEPDAAIPVDVQNPRDGAGNNAGKGGQVLRHYAALPEPGAAWRDRRAQRRRTDQYDGLSGPPRAAAGSDDPLMPHSASGAATRLRSSCRRISSMVFSRHRRRRQGLDLEVEFVYIRYSRIANIYEAPY